MQDTGRRVDASALAVGLVMIFIGLALTVDRLDIVEFDDYWRYFPLILIAFGLARLLSPRQGRGRGGGLWLLMIGIWLQINMLEAFGFHWGNSWPLLLVAVGLSMAVGAVFPGFREPHRDYRTLVHVDVGEHGSRRDVGEHDSGRDVGKHDAGRDNSEGEGKNEG